MIKNTTFSHVSDKGISVGEKSMVDVRDVVIRNVTNAIVAKDGSVVEIENAVLAHAERALVAIMKKSGYGPAELSATGITLDDVDTPYLLEEGSRMQINGINMTSNTQHGKAIIYQ